MSHTVASVNGSGLLQTEYTGSGSVVASLGGKEGLSGLVVQPPAPPYGQLSVMPATAITYPEGPDVQLTAIASYSTGEVYNVTSYASWESGNSGIATVASGLVAPVASGITPVTAYFDGAAASAGIEVLKILYISIAVTPSPTLNVGNVQLFTAIATLTNGETANITSVCSWNSSDGNILAMGAGGLGSALAVGSCEVSASYLGVSGATTASVVDAVPLPVLDSGAGTGGSGTGGNAGSGTGSGGGEGGYGGGADGALAPSGGSEVFMCCSNWPTLLSWDRVSANAKVVTGSPANVKHIAWFGQYMYALTDTTLWFSDTSNPYSWPSDNNIPLSYSLGTPRYLKAMQDRLYIFCSNGVFYLIGDPEVAGSLYIGIFLQDIPCTKGNIAFDGGTCLFISYENIIGVTGNLDNTTQNVLGLSLQIPMQTWLAATPEYLLLRSYDIDGATLLYVFDRTRYRCWYRWRYEINSALGCAFAGTDPVVVSPHQLCVLAYQQAGQMGFIIPGQDGNLYFQGVAALPWEQRYPLGIPNMQDYPGVPIINRLGTRFTACVEDRLMGKQLRGFSIYGRGSNVKVNFNFVDDMSNMLNYTPPLATNTLPFEQPTVLQDLPCNTWQETQMVVTGTQMSIRELAWSWRPLRYLTPRLGR